MEIDELAERIAQVFEKASPRVRRTLFTLPRERKFPEGVADPNERGKLDYWKNWSDLLGEKLKNKELQPIGFGHLFEPATPARPSPKGGYDHA